MDTNARLIMLQNKIDDDAATKAKEMETLEKIWLNYAERIELLDEKITEVCDLATALKKNDLDDNIPKEFVSCGIEHRVGFMGRRRSYERVGFYNGGYCGKWDFYVDRNGDFYEAYEDDRNKTRKAEIKHMKKFLDNFNEFYNGFLKWFDEFSQSREESKVMFETYYKVEMVNGSGSMPDKYKTYEDAYAAMCKNYSRELEEGYKPTLYKIMRYDVSNYGGATNTMVQPVWS